MLTTVRYAIRILTAWYAIEGCVAVCEGLLEVMRPSADSDDEEEDDREGVECELGGGE
jgi:hypothetical protein